MFSAVADRAQPNITLDSLDRVAIGYLSLPLAVFLIGWFEWWAAVPLLACACYSIKVVWADPLPGTIRHPINRFQVAWAIGVGCAWSLIGGADHVVFANADWVVRDAVLHDLVVSPWPVGYGLLDGSESVLRAPIAFYLPAALVGKALGLAAAHVAMGVWTGIGASLFLLQVMSLVPARVGPMVTVTLVVLLFSGMDMVGNLLNDGPRFRSDWNITTHLEWWAGKYQYSSMTTQLFWVPNHALGGWITAGLLCRTRRSVALDALLPMLVILNALWSPLTAIGLAPFVLLELARGSFKRVPANLSIVGVWSAATLVGVVVALYLGMDPGRIPHGLPISQADATPIMDLLQQAQFFLIEAGFIGAAIIALRPSYEVALALLILALLPLVQLGPNNDIVMRASIPSLAILTIGACLALVEHSGRITEFRYKAALVALLIVGALTPAAEFARAILLPAWPIDFSSTLINANCGGFPPHYIARADDGLIDRLLKSSNRLALGPIGPYSCRNRAFELMWNWSFTPRRTDLHPAVSMPAPSVNP